jgi:hypothetical protein
LREDVTKEFRDGKKDEFTPDTIIELYRIILLGGGDTEWVSCAIGKENMAGQHCNHCQWSQKDFIEGLGEPWTIQKIKMQPTIIETRLYQLWLTQLPSLQGTKSHPIYSIPIHL